VEVDQSAACLGPRRRLKLRLLSVCGYKFVLEGVIIWFLVGIVTSLSSVAAQGVEQGFQEWKQTLGDRQWSFPRDHGIHQAYRTEWWYFTGNLADHKGSRYGYQLTFFRQGLRSTPSDRKNPWSVRDVYLAHFTVTDIGRGRFWVAERVSRSGPGLAGARKGGMDIWLLDWSAKKCGETIALHARHGATDLELQLTPAKGPTLHGKNGLSRKGPGPGQASYYYSYPRLTTKGTIQTAETKALAVSGTSWFDHEFGSNQLGPEQMGWDWFGLRLSDGRDLMVYLLRKKDGSVEPSSSGTLVEAGGSTRHLDLSDIQVAVLATWKSRRSAGTYPAGWRIRVPAARIDLTVTPLLADQELHTEASTGITYWEGAVGGRGSSGDRMVSVEGYVELTGYAGSIGGLF
jgi:predicted secreted hydrolase